MTGQVRRMYSYSDQRRRRSRILRSILVFSLIFFAFVLLNGFFLASYRVASVAMKPALLPGDCLLVSPLVYGPRTPFSSHKLPGLMKPHRGDLVLVEPPSAELNSPGSVFLGAILRFVSFQRLGRKSNASLPLVKRVVGIPGDRISILDSVVRVRRQGQQGSMSEYELVDRLYETEIADIPAHWTADLPYSGSMPEILLGADSYFLLNDDRSSTGDSRAWGPVPAERILARVLMRYWPLTRR